MEELSPTPTCQSPFLLTEMSPASSEKPFPVARSDRESPPRCERFLSHILTGLEVGPPLIILYEKGFPQWRLRTGATTMSLTRSGCLTKAASLDTIRYDLKLEPHESESTFETGTNLCQAQALLERQKLLDVHIWMCRCSVYGHALEPSTRKLKY